MSNVERPTGFYGVYPVTVSTFRIVLFISHFYTKHRKRCGFLPLHFTSISAGIWLVFFVSVFHVIWTWLKNLNVQSKNRFQISTVGGFFWNFILLLSLSYFYWSQVFLITGNKPPFYSLSTEKIRSTRFLQIKLILTEEKIIKHKRNNSWFFFLFCFKWGKTEKKRERKKEELYGAIYGRSGPSWVPQWVLVHFWNIYLMVHIFLI